MSIRRISLNVGSRPIGTALTWSYPNDDGKTYVIPTYSVVVTGTDAAGKKTSTSFEAFRFGVYRPTPTAAPRVVGLAEYQTHAIKAWIPTYSVHSAQSDETGAWQVYKNFLIHDGPDDPMAEPPFASIGCVEICGPRGFLKFNDLLIALSGSTKPSRDGQLAEIGSSGNLSISYEGAKRPALKVA